MLRNLVGVSPKWYNLMEKRGQEEQESEGGRHEQRERWGESLPDRCQYVSLWVDRDGQKEGTD